MSVVSTKTNMSSLELDPCDKYLLQNGFFRKHATADASSLFRVISDHIFETETYHPKLRTSCIDYMAKNRSLFEGVIQHFEIFYNIYIGGYFIFYTFRHRWSTVISRNICVN